MIQLEDASGFPGSADTLLTPSDERELVGIMQSASQSRTPVTIVGARTGLAGGGMPDGGIAVSMDRFRSMELRAGEATVGAGVLLRDLQAESAKVGQFYGPDCTENSSSMGGNIATNASGSRSFRYGDTRRSVLSLRVVLIDGSVLVIRRGDPIPFDVPKLSYPATTKFSAGFDLRPGSDYVDVFIGSEGILGVVTEANVRLLPMPKAILSGVVFFASEEDALDAVDAWRPVPRLRMLEYADSSSLDLLRSRNFEVPSKARACVIIESEAEDNDSEVDAWVDRLDAAHALAEDSWFGTTPTDRERFRVFRHALPESVNDTVRRRGFQKMGTDFAVPIPRNREIIAYYRKRLDDQFPGQNAVIYGHIGDGHVHVNLLPADADAVARGRMLIHEFAEKVVSLGGTVGAEHGLGKRKRDFLKLQWTPEEIQQMRAIKQRFDPHWLLGRGTLFAPPTL